MENLIGKKFGLLTIVSDVFLIPSGKVQVKYVNVVCDCGTAPHKTRLSPLTTGKTLSCGCLRAKTLRAKMTSKVGEVHGKLTVIKDDLKMIGKRRYVIVRCDCGSAPFEVRYDRIIGEKQNTKSCGCWYDETRGVAATTHGMHKTRIYQSWQNMKDRCTNPKSARYGRYGGRGIRVCAEWLNSFEKFYEDMSSGYADNLVLDRIDFNGNYCKENCRWVDDSVSNHNKSKRSDAQTSEFIGVYYDKRSNFWISRLNKNSEVVFYKKFKDELEAATAYDNASEIYYDDRPNNTLKE